MPEQIPLPSHAASFWIAGDDLWIAFPGQGPNERGHSIRLPASVAGLQTAISILKTRSAPTKLGERGTPTQYDLETDEKFRKWLGAMNASKAATANERAQAKAELEELGL